MSSMLTRGVDRVYNGLEVMAMDATQKAIEIVEALPAEKLKIAVGILELLAKNDDTENLKELIDLINFEMSCKTAEITVEEKEGIIKGEAEIKAGKGVKAEDVWKEFGI